MAHKSLIGGTVYEKYGGADLIDGTVYAKNYGKTLVGGTAYEVGFSSWADDIDTGLEFVSASAFSISVASPGWDGTMEYCNGKDWVAWDGSVISSSESESGQRIYVRGTGNTKITGGTNKEWTLTGTDIKCKGNIEKLLDYVTVMAGEHPEMAYACYYGMFQYCRSLITAPSLPATTLTGDCYNNMFLQCSGLTTIPSLPATTLVFSCYANMFRYCTNIKLSSTQTGEYQTAYRIPKNGTGTTATNALQNMFQYTGGTFTSAPTINTTYYTSNTVV